MEDFSGPAAVLLNSSRVPIENLEDGKCLLVPWKFSGHVVRRRECHHGVEPNIILASKRTGVGEGCGGGELAQVGAGLNPGSQQGKQAFGWRLLHEADERFERAEVERNRGLPGEGGGNSQIGGQA